MIFLGLNVVSISRAAFAYARFVGQTEKIQKIRAHRHHQHAKRGRSRLSPVIRLSAMGSRSDGVELPRAVTHALGMDVEAV